jgi:hypothetical protein
MDFGSRLLGFDSASPCKQFRGPTSMKNGAWNFENEVDTFLRDVGNR